MAGDRDLVLELIEQRKGDALRAEAAELDRLADKTDRTNRSMGDLGAQSRGLSTRIDEQTVKVRELAREIERGGGDDKGLFRQFAAAERDLNKLKRVSKTLEELVPEMGAAGTKAGTSFMGGLGGAISQGFPPEAKAALIAGGIGAAAALAPAVGAVLAGAVVGAVGVGGIVGGVAAAAQDPAVRFAAVDLKNVLVSEFADSGRLFVKPTLEGIEILKDAVRDIDLTHMLGPLADEVPVLAKGLGDMARAMEPGLSRAFEAAGPGIELLAEHLPEIGKALGDMIGDISESKGAMEGLSMALDVVEGTLRIVGGTVTWLSDKFALMVDVGAAVGEKLSIAGHVLVPTWTGLTGLIDSNTGALERWQQSSGGATGSAQGLAKSVMNATTEATRLADAALIAASSLREFHSAQLAATTSMLSAKGALLDFKQAVKDHGASLSDNTKVGIDNQQMLVGLADKYAAARDKAIANGVETGKANNKYMDQINALQGLALKLDMNEDKVWALIGAYKSVPRGPFTTEFIQKYVTQGTPGEHSGGRIIDARAGGGPVRAGQPYIVGENRPELFVPDVNGHIEPRVPTGARGSAMSASSGGGSFAPLNVQPGTFADVLVAILRDAIRTQYGGNIELGLGTR